MAGADGGNASSRQHIKRYLADANDRYCFLLVKTSLSSGCIAIQAPCTHIYAAAANSLLSRRKHLNNCRYLSLGRSIIGEGMWIDCVGECFDKRGIPEDLMWSNVERKLFLIDTSKASGWQKEGIPISDDEEVKRLTRELCNFAWGDASRFVLAHQIV